LRGFRLIVVKKAVRRCGTFNPSNLSGKGNGDKSLLVKRFFCVFFLFLVSFLVILED